MTTLNNGYLGSRNDEERSEMWYVVWIAEFRESSNLWTHIALEASAKSTSVSASVTPSLSNHIWVCIWPFHTYSVCVVGWSEQRTCRRHRKGFLFSIGWLGFKTYHTLGWCLWMLSLWLVLRRNLSISPQGVCFHNSTWAQAGLPAELKHINKRRKRN